MLIDNYENKQGEELYANDEYTSYFTLVNNHPAVFYTANKYVEFKEIETFKSFKPYLKFLKNELISIAKEEASKALSDGNPDVTGGMVILWATFSDNKLNELKENTFFYDDIMNYQNFNEDYIEEMM